MFVRIVHCPFANLLLATAFSLAHAVSCCESASATAWFGTREIFLSKFGTKLFRVGNGYPPPPSLDILESWICGENGK